MKKRVLILGGSSDIGEELVKLYLKNNYNVIAHYNKNIKNLKKINNKNLSFLKFDLRKVNSFEKFIKKKQKIFLNLDILVSLTGYFSPKKIDNIKVSDFSDHINVNYLSNFLLVRSVTKGMLKRKWGRIILSSSIGTKFGGSDKSFVYSLSKYMNQFFPKIYKSFIKKNVLINTLQIGLTNTKIQQIDKTKNLKKRVKLIPLARMASVTEVAIYIYFLTSEKNNLIANQLINISGGE